MLGPFACKRVWSSWVVPLMLSGCLGSARDDDAQGSGSPADGDSGGMQGESTGGPSPDCTGDDDCRAPGLGVCNPATGRCVGCLEHDDCSGEARCNAATGWCMGCDDDASCPEGTSCAADGSCVPGCDVDGRCSDGFTCCAARCSDLQTDLRDCGACGESCPDLAHATEACIEGECSLAGCESGWSDCDGVGFNGCETQGECSCVPGDTRPCYSGPPATEGRGECVAGVQTCNDEGVAWGACVGEVLPRPEVCANEADDDCDGSTDEDVDADQDGWTACGGDCCDLGGAACSDPERVNPGAFEVAGNRVDDDCDGVVDNEAQTCDVGLSSNSGNAFDYARALDLCNFTETNPPDPADRTWGILDAWWSLADGTGSPHPNARSLRSGFGSVLDPRRGDRMVVLSTGHAADVDDQNPGFEPFQVGVDLERVSEFPSDWLGANGGALPNAPGCVTPFATEARDPIMLTLRLRVPTNAHSFSVDMFFLSAEYPEYVCTAFNDFFVALLETADPNNPDDENIAIYDAGAQTWPVGVNLLAAAPGLFTMCEDGPISQCAQDPEVTQYSGCTSSSALEGTGFDLPGGVFFDCDDPGTTGGGTGWLRLRGNVVPGETMTLRLAIWDTSDPRFDSVVLLDGWTWSVQPSEPGVIPG